uniref:Amidohydrolase-related domain-containing protein n=1 Tax=Geoglobus ahangari TaxID=113653 RepID=A0A7C4W410_9EURY
MIWNHRIFNVYLKIKFMKLIDAHVHLGYSIPPEKIVSQMRESSVEKVVVFALPAEVDPNPKMNDYVLEKSKEYGFIPYYYVTDTEIPEEIEEFKGFKWHWFRGWTHVKSNLSLFNDGGFTEFLRELNELGKPIVIEEDFEFTEKFVKIIDKSPVIIPHLGLISGEPLDFLTTFRDVDNVYFDTALASVSLIERFYNELGSEKLIFGSDIPFGRMKEELNKILSLSLPEKELRQIVGENILRLIEP